MTPRPRVCTAANALSATCAESLGVPERAADAPFEQSNIANVRQMRSALRRDAGRITRLVAIEDDAAAVGQVFEDV